MEMFLLRLMHLSSIKLKKNTDINSVSENPVIDKEINDQSKPIDQIKNIYQEEKSKPEIHKEVKSEKKIFINSLEKLIQTCLDKKEIKLKYELEKNVNLVKFEKNMIEISFNENLDKNFVKDLSSKLFDWTGERWIISFSQLKGDVSMREKKQKIKRSLMDEAKNSKIYKDVIKNFPDAELTDINLKREDEPND
jgi:DNA polymerase-3 subunit gamma/tau